MRRIAARYGVAHSTVAAHVVNEGWVERKPAGVRVVPKPAPDASAPEPAGALVALAVERFEPREPDTAETRIRRMLGIIDLQLDLMERHMTSGQPVTTQDLERQARAFGAIAGNLEKVTEAAADIFRDPGQDGAADGARDADSIRREIAERLERLNAQWLAQERAR